MTQPDLADQADQAAVAEGEPSGEVPRRAWRSLWIAGGVAVWIGLYLAQVLGSQFFADDFLYLQLARQGHIDLGWFAVNNYGHFAPVTRLAYLLLERYGDLDYRLAAVVPATLGTLVFLALAWTGQSLLGRSRTVLVLAVVGATSVPLLRVVLWWGASVHVLGAAACMTICIAGFVAHCRSGGRLALLVSLAGLTTGLLVQERPLITVGYLVLIRYLFGVGDLPEERWSRAWFRREAVLWAPFALVTLAYLVYRLFVFDSAPQPGSLHQAVLFMASGTLRSYLPSLVGVRSAPDAGWVEVPTVLGALLLLAVGAFIAARRHGVWKCAFFLAATYVVNLGLLAAGRLGVADAIWQSRDLQYFVDVHLATVLAILLGLGALPPRETPAGDRRRLMDQVLGVAVVAVLLTTAVQWHSVITNNQETPAHGYIGRARSELAQRTDDYDLLRFMVPRDVAPDFLDPYTDQPGIFSLVPSVRQHLSPTSPTKIVVLDSGHVRTAHPVGLAQVAGGSKAIALGAGSRATLRSVGGASCVNGRRASIVTAKLPRTLTSDALFLLVRYSTSTPVRMRASAVSAAGTSFNNALTTLPAGTHVAVVDRLDGHEVSTVALTLSSRARDLCIDTVWVGNVAADDGHGCRVLDRTAKETGVPADCSTPWLR
ncbi:hypothetical protein [Nocardioides pocheonensis]|uniref:Glycosyltransferase RgtA/B/C/D-like domain-containing protein n=1 Tax=Nocardioides pocheonensis TaxID=661485 RepID=A0A3N0GNY3_9ACTN|nr:hypothetical protein [Nocardioides pocheonensis]RNM13790.1 hypothetical protein EFL26_12520 [Nocardioides pocheonensis]